MLLCNNTPFGVFQFVVAVIYLVISWIYGHWWRFSLIRKNWLTVWLVEDSWSMSTNGGGASYCWVTVGCPFSDTNVSTSFKSVARTFCKIGWNWWKQWRILLSSVLHFVRLTKPCYTFLILMGMSLNPSMKRSFELRITK